MLAEGLLLGWGGAILEGQLSLVLQLGPAGASMISGGPLLLRASKGLMWESLLGLFLRLLLPPSASSRLSSGGDTTAVWLKMSWNMARERWMVLGAEKMLPRLKGLDSAVVVVSGAFCSVGGVRDFPCLDCSLPRCLD